MKRYEIINPSDECYLSGDDLEAVCAAGLMLGRGKYGLKEAATDKKKALPIFLFGGHNEWWIETFGHSFAEYFVLANYQKIADVLKTCRYPRARSSMNNIVKASKANARNLEAAIKAAAVPI